MSELELHNKIIQIVKSNDINIRIVDFVESREWEAYMIEKPKTQIDKNDI
jgi:hypothetical protein